MEEKLFWIGFNKVKGIGSVRTKNLLDYFGKLSLAWEASSHDLRQAGLGPKTIDAFLQERKTIDLSAEWDRMMCSGIQVVTVNEDAYPSKLKSIEQPPPVLYIKGDLSCRDENAIAIVGTRLKTAYGKQVATELCSFLARNQITVVSGLARGIDSIAHAATIESGGRTIAVLGNGVDVVYPPEHRELSKQIESNGALVSEYFPGTPPDGVNFPPRNRIISGLSAATVIIEAGDRSGALITAEFAANQGREVFAVPGPIFSMNSKGTNRLIRDGAIPLLQYDELLNLLNLEKISEFRYAKKVLPENEIELLIMQKIKDEPMHIDEIKANLDLTMEKVSATLVMMELKGLVRQVSHMTYLSIQDEINHYEVK